MKRALKFRLEEGLKLRVHAAAKAAAAVVVFLSVLSGAPSRLSADLWRDEDFLARFTATYGVRGDREPQVSREEQNLLREVASHMPGNPQEAAAVLERGLRTDSSAALDFTLGNLRFQLDQFREAETCYREAIRKFPDFLRAHKNLGLVLARLDENAEAVSALSRALTLGSADGDTYGVIGFAHFQQGHPVSAEAAYRQAVLFEPDNVNWQVGLARALQAQDRHAEAAALMGELTSRHPERHEFWLYQANTFVALGKPDKAAANLELVRRMGRLGQDGLLLLADIYVNDDLPVLALSAFEEVLRGGASVPFIRAVRAAERLSQRGHSGEAARLVEWVEEKMPAELSPRELGQFRRLKARIAVAKGEDEEAREFLTLALETDPLDGESLLLLARLVAEEDLERSEVLLTQAARISQVAPQALRQHGELLVSAGHYAAALEPLRQAQVLQPSEPLRRYIERVERLAEIEESRSR